MAWRSAQDTLGHDAPVDIEAHLDAMVEMHELLDEHFAEDELRTLVFNLHYDYDNIPGETKSGKARELVLLMDRENRLKMLVSECRRKRPSVSWPTL